MEAKKRNKKLTKFFEKLSAEKRHIFNELVDAQK
jgi:hypothetical protein